MRVVRGPRRAGVRRRPAERAGRVQSAAAARHHPRGRWQATDPVLMVRPAPVGTGVRDGRHASPLLRIAAQRTAGRRARRPADGCGRVGAVATRVVQRDDGRWLSPSRARRFFSATSSACRMDLRAACARVVSVERLVAASRDADGAASLTHAIYYYIYYDRALYIDALLLGALYSAAPRSAGSARPHASRGLAARIHASADDRPVGLPSVG